jgi:hypothetical protein
LLFLKELLNTEDRADMVWLARPCKHKLLVGLFEGEVKVEVSLPEGFFD